jgi:hypothetical protein
MVYMLGTGRFDSAAVTGRMNSRQVVLEWSMPFGTEISHMTLYGQLSPDGQTVTVRAVTVNGGQPSASPPLRRQSQPN